MDSAIIETCHLDYSFHSGSKILKDVSLFIPKNSIYGFLGPNGAGKTTTMRLLLGLLYSKPGKISIFGNDLHSNRRSILNKIGSFIEQPSLYLHLTGRENLEILRLSYRCSSKRIDEVLHISGLTKAAGQKTKSYSLGMKQRLAIAIALLNDPELLILDEPTNGLDPTGIIEMRDLITKLHKEFGKTILISSHLLSEVEKLATDVGIINEGKLLFQGKMEELVKLTSLQSIIKIEVDNSEKARQVLNDKYEIKEEKNGNLHIAFQTKTDISDMNDILVFNRIKVYQIERIQNNLENIFLQVIAS